MSVYGQLSYFKPSEVVPITAHHYFNEILLKDGANLAEKCRGTKINTFKQYLIIELFNVL